MATEQFHVPVINGGLEAGMGTYGVLLLWSRLTKPGDTLVLAIEPPLLLSSQERYGFKVLNHSEITKYRQFTDQSVYPARS